MKPLAEALGVARSNLIEQLKLCDSQTIRLWSGTG